MGDAGLRVLAGSFFLRRFHVLACVRSSSDGGKKKEEKVFH